ncbi:DNA polymerase Y family protein [Methylobacterium sp. J-072]|uniref:DNA polymerase Y family protein n=1 Tax=Methylobacterium sp. J-072 TaxID=2836651 RepID=UPI001FB89AA9|nr:DNA polymerase Y family protein [Methylobacterium sp. J-072]MCJ2092471.1 DNA polymerase Y family protein [Methylobacterium sp. J-072]
MPRIVCVCLSHWPVTRLRRAGLAPDRGPLAVAAEGPGGLRLLALDPEARALGLRPGEPLGRVRARIGVPLQVHPADPDSDRAALLRLCRWAEGYAPGVAPFGAAEAADGFYIDVAGASHLRGGEAKLVDDLAGRLARSNIPARIALADTPGGAFALACYGASDRVVVPPGGAAEPLRGLPVAALRLDPGTVSGLQRLGLRRVGEVDALSRGPLARRFGEALLLRLDQAMGRRPEPLAPLTEEAAYRAARGFLDPIGRQSDIVVTARLLMAEIAPRLERDGVGACALRLVLHRVDGVMRVLDLGLSRPERCPERVAALVSLRLDRLGAGLDAGFGFETVALTVTVTGTLSVRQTELGAAPQGDGIDALADALTQRLGRPLLRLGARASHIPERAAHTLPWTLHGSDSASRKSRRAPSPVQERVGVRDQVSPERSHPSPGSLREQTSPALAPRPASCASDNPWTSAPTSWPDHLPPRPLVLFPRGEAALDVLSTVPEGPPRRFRWRARIHAIVHAEGPERIAAEWWHAPAEARDYYRVECEAGRRLWLYRDGPHAPGRPAAWFVHGVFA